MSEPARIVQTDGADHLELQRRHNTLMDRLEGLGDTLDDAKWAAITDRLAELDAKPLPTTLRLRMATAYLAWALRYPERIGADPTSAGRCRCGSKRGAGMVLRSSREDPDDPFASGTEEAVPCGNCNREAYERAHAYNRYTGRSHLHCSNAETCDDCQAAIDQARNQQQIPV